MSVQIWQLLNLVLFALIFTSIWYAKKTKIRILLVIIAFVIFAVNPVRFKQLGVSSLERFSVESDPLPERVVLEIPEFHERQRAEMEKLKKESMEVLDAEIN